MKRNSVLTWLKRLLVRIWTFDQQAAYGVMERKTEQGASLITQPDPRIMNHRQHSQRSEDGL